MVNRSRSKGGIDTYIFRGSHRDLESDKKKGKGKVYRKLVG